MYNNFFQLKKFNPCKQIPAYGSAFTILLELLSPVLVFRV